MIVTRTITRAIVAERKPEEPESSGCFKGGCGCLLLLILLFTALGLIGSCVDATERQVSDWKLSNSVENVP